MIQARRLVPLLLLLPVLATQAHAQLSPAAKLSQVAANQLGILEYCHDHGQASAEAVRAEREAFNSAPSTNLSTVPAETLGRSGISVGPHGDQLPLADLLARQSTSIAAYCKDLADSSIEFRAEIRALTKP